MPDFKAHLACKMTLKECITVAVITKYPPRNNNADERLPGRAVLSDVVGFYIYIDLFES
jgi:hypothetical protein